MKNVEIERKFEVGKSDEVPSLEGILGRGETREHRLRAVYFDTRDGLLARHGITLRRREGGVDEGWHLKLPRADGDRLEISGPIVDGPGTYSVPSTLLAELRRAVGHELPEGADGVLLPVATLETHRRDTKLVDPTGKVRATLSDDTVTVRPVGKVWREVEVELLGEDPELLERIVGAFKDAGIKKSKAPSKLSRALDGRSGKTAWEVVLAYAAEQVAEMIGREDAVRSDDEDAVHKARVATRRLRSTLRTFRCLFHRNVTDPLRDEVKWLGTVLGEPRDAEVLKERLQGHIDELAEGDIVGPARDRVGSELDAQHRDSHRALVEVLDSERYAALRDALVGLLADPPLRGRASGKAKKELPRLVRRAIGRAEEQWAASREADGDEQLHLLHETRKKSKAARYGCEALEPAFGDAAVEAAERWEEVTETLGVLQDSLVARTRLRELATVAHDAGEPTFTYGILVGVEAMRAERARTEGEAATRRALEHPWP